MTAKTAEIHSARGTFSADRCSMRMPLRKLVLVAPLLLGGCGWFDWFGSSTPVSATSVRPGVDRQSTVNGLPAAPQRGRYDGSEAPQNDTRGQQLGGVVQGKGGQKAQLADKEKERARVEAERTPPRPPELPQTERTAQPEPRPPAEPDSQNSAPTTQR